MEKGDFTPVQTRALVDVLELTQRKTAREVETDLREYRDARFAAIAARFAVMEDKFDALDDKFVTKAEFYNVMGEQMRWMFIFWSTRLLAIAGMIFGAVKLLKP